MPTVFTDAGETWTRDKINEDAQTLAEWIGWGTGAGAAVKGSTVLITEATEARVQGVRTKPAVDTNRVVGTITANGTKTITNAGVFTASTVGILVIHADFTGVPVQLNDAIEFTFDLVWS